MDKNCNQQANDARLTGKFVGKLCCVPRGRLSINNSEDVPAQKKTQALMSSFPTMDEEINDETTASKR